MSQNFEELYTKLKEEFELSKKDNDEICKEYESTIEMLTESVESFKKEKLYTKKENYTLNINFKNNYNPTGLNLSSESKKNNPINSVINLEPRINLTCLKKSFNSERKINLYWDLK